MIELPLSHSNFVSTAVFEADYATADGVETLCIEVRTYIKKLNASQTQMLFTMIDGREVRVSSIFDLILLDKKCLSLSIPHSVMIEWNNKSKRAILTEIYIPNHGPQLGKTIKLLLSVDGNLFETSSNDVLQDAFEELNELIAPQKASRLKICYQCNFSYPKLPGRQDERENLQCFRDNLEYFDEVKEAKKFASDKALNSGDFFVNAFHTCAAWKRWQPSDFKEG